MIIGARVRFEYALGDRLLCALVHSQLLLYDAFAGSSVSCRHAYPACF